MWCVDVPVDGFCDNGTNDMDGTMVTTFMDTLNDVGGGGTNCFAGYCDWRIPNVKELLDIVNYEIPSPGPAVDGVFNTACVPACTVLTCSCTFPGLLYWSSTTYQAFPNVAWAVSFNDGSLGTAGKFDNLSVRAVRGGL
jgi:hypothetical protein